MSLQAAYDLWGSEVVKLAIAAQEHAPVTSELAAEIHRRADPPGAFRAWALALPWPQFCAVVRVVSGAIRREVETA